MRDMAPEELVSGLAIRVMVSVNECPEKVAIVDTLTAYTARADPTLWDTVAEIAEKAKFTDRLGYVTFHMASILMAAEVLLPDEDLFEAIQQMFAVLPEMSAEEDERTTKMAIRELRFLVGRRRLPHFEIAVSP